MVNFFTFKNFDSALGCRHAVSMKDMHEFYGFSLALHTGEKAEKIVENRYKLASLLHWDEKLYFAMANQTHSNHIAVIEKHANQGWDRLDTAIEDCDAMITNQKNIVLCILTADCVPILLCDTKQNVIAAVHAGWKGTQGKIVLKTVQKMIKDFQTNPEDIIAGIAPAIGRCCYEVGEDVVKHFYAFPHAYEKKGDTYMLDLPLINREQLLSVGVLADNIEMSDICTSCNIDAFFSYRKEKGCSGRFMSMIGLV